jgi:heat shock protein HtpX
MNLEPLDPSGPYGFVVKRVHEYANSARIDPPEVYRYDIDELNAFATGPSKNNSLVAISQGLLDDFDQAEVEGVLGHEVAHIANGDMVTMALVQGVVNAFVMFLARIVAIAIDNVLSEDDEGEGLGFFAYFAVVSILQLVFGLLTAPLVAWFSRAREYKADAGGAQLAGREKMLSALRALEGQFSVDRLDTSTPAFKSMKISGKGVIALLSTHPPLSDRIRALESRSTR